MEGVRKNRARAFQRERVTPQDGSKVLQRFVVRGAFAQVDETVSIRLFRKEDRESIRRICCDTGFFGQPIETFFQDRQLFADLLTAPYLAYEPEWALVAESGNKVVGYLLGSVRPSFDRLLVWSGFLASSQMLLRTLSGRYSNHPSSKWFVRWLFTSGLCERPKHPKNAAHLHLNLEKKYRGCGIGRRLWQTYEQMLDAAGIRSCYGEFFSSHRRRPERMYKRYQFSVFDRRRTSLFQHVVSEPVDIVCVQKWL